MKELAELSDLEFDRNEARTTVEKLKKAAKRSGNGADGAISDAAKEIAEGIEEDDDDQAMAGAKRLGDKGGKQARKKKINDLLNAELAELNDVKSNVQQNSTAKKARRNRNRPILRRRGGWRKAVTSMVTRPASGTQMSIGNK